MTNPGSAERLCKEIIRRFHADIPYFYLDEDRQRGYFISVDRQGQAQKFHLCSVSIAVVTNEQRRIPDFLALSSLAAEVKKVAKGIEGSRFARDRRNTARRRRASWRTDAVFGSKDRKPERLVGISERPANDRPAIAPAVEA